MFPRLEEGPGKEERPKHPFPQIHSVCTCSSSNVVRAIYKDDMFQNDRNCIIKINLCYTGRIPLKLRMPELGTNIIGPLPERLVSTDRATTLRIFNGKVLSNSVRVAQN